MARARTREGVQKKARKSTEDGGLRCSACDATSAVARREYHDLGIFACRKIRVWRERFGTNDDLVQGAQTLFGEKDSDTLEIGWESI